MTGRENMGGVQQLQLDRLMLTDHPPEGLGDIAGPVVYRARRIVFALGLKGGGGIFLPPLVQQLPAELRAHTEDDIDFSVLQGRRVIVLGGGASGFDNASAALEAGAASVEMHVRRPDIPRQNSLRWMEFPGVQEHYYVLTDEHDVEHVGDYVISATGYAVDPGLRPELDEFLGDIALWSEEFGPAAEHPMGQCPYLGDGFQFQAKGTASAEAASYIPKLFHLSTGARVPRCGRQAAVRHLRRTDPGGQPHRHRHHQGELAGLLRLLHRLPA